MSRRVLVAATALGLVAAAALADPIPVTEEDAFRRAIDGKVLSRPLIRLQVRGDGTITGTGAARSVTGEWVWKDGYFCRDLTWGGRDLGYNCQEVRLAGSTIRFTSDRGTGDHADFRIVEP